jgi:thiol-disulfide isomerase/thioredoxin
MFFSVAFALLLNGCANEKTKHIIKISGNIANLNAKKIYLTDAIRWNIFLDSAVCYNGHFEFVLDSSQFREPFFASMCILNQKNEIKQLPVINYKKTSGIDTFSNTGFFLSWGTTEISGDCKKDNYRFSINRNSENDLFFDPKTEYFASNKNLPFIKETIRKHPDSYFLLQQLFTYKHLFTKKELYQLLFLFGSELRSAQFGLQIKLYADYGLDKGTLLPGIPVMNLNNERIDMLDNIAKLNMLIFWASWCGPCRTEIAQLKELTTKYSKYDIQLKSISIDYDKLKWKKAVYEESMQWEQLLVEADELSKIKAQFDVNLIPTVVFVNKDRKIIQRFVGYKTENIDIYSNFIDIFFSQNK